ncbi:hypothetical protein P692DRAFT_201874207 [Suillus brevipes Sb2]|nr:hypothetical protein P692DRAFT_201874207 [Suillus brevipes Sb2]
MTPPAAPDPTVSVTMPTNLLTNPTDSDQCPSESEPSRPAASECARTTMTSPPPDIILQDSQNTIYATPASLPQIKNPLAKLVPTKKPNPLEPPSALAPPTNDPAPQNSNPTVLPVSSPMPATKDTTSPTPAAGTTDVTCDIATTKKFRPSATKNGRNLCAHRWLKVLAPNGTSGDFKTYWNALSKDSQQASFIF